MQTKTALLALLLFQAALFAEDKKVAILVYNDVELLDFGGPGEVFGAAPGFDVYTVALSTEPILSQRFLTVVPEFAISDAPKPDILILPGGNTRSVSGNAELIGWIQEVAQDADIIMSVCTGARLLAEAGLLDGKKATTWYGFIDRLQELAPEATILRQTRFVDNGQLVTTAGVSAGIDGALHVLSRLRGTHMAERVAKYMEYDKWEPEAGLIIPTPLLRKLRDGDTKAGMVALKAWQSNGSTRPPFFEGEINDLGQAYLDTGETERAVKICQLALEAYPNSEYAHRALVQAFTQLDRPHDAKTHLRHYVALNPRDLEAVDRLGIDQTLKLFEALAKRGDLDERQVNSLGYRLLAAERIRDAIRVFKLNVAAFPDSWNVYDSLGEAYLKAGDRTKAAHYYQKSLNLNPENKHAKKILQELQP